MRDDLASLPLTEFRAEIRTWLEEYCPPSILRPVDRLQGAEAAMWYKIRSQHGLIAPGWPAAYGGLELSVDHQIAMLDEFEQYGVARAFDMGVAMLGPTLIRYGTAEQKDHYLPRILSGEHIWCQGYSEPGAGSDLASLRTAAVRDGDEYVVNGQKIWTSAANHATHCFLLVRTANTGKKQEGISFLLVDLKTPGIRVRPIRNLAGQEELCEVFYDDVRVPAANLVGAEGQGWSIAKSLLGFERLATGSPAPSQLALSIYRKIARHLGVASDPLVRDLMAQHELRLHELLCLFRTGVAKTAQGSATDSDMSALKIVASETFQRIAESVIQLAGEHGAVGYLDTAEGRIDIRQLYMVSRPTTIFGGSSEVQRNILAKRWLHLPDERS